MSSLWVRLQRLIYRNRWITFTPIGTRFVLLTLAIGIAAVNTGNNLLYLVVGMMLSLIIVSGISSNQSLRRIEIQWGFPERMFARQPVVARLRIRNGKRVLPSFSFRVEEEGRPASSVYVFNLPAGQIRAISYRTTFNRRGRQRLPALMLQTAFPFGFFNKTLNRPTTQEVLVYPRVLPVPEGLETVRSQAGRTFEQHQRGRGATLHSLRDYTSADDARGIHWKASAHEAKLLVKEYEREEEHRVLLCLSNHLPIVSGARASESGSASAGTGVLEDFERAVELAASLAVRFRRMSHPVVLKTLAPDEAQEEETLDLDALLRRLALLEPLPALASESVTRRIAALTRSSATVGRRVLILPFPDPLWDGARGYYSEVWVASEPRFVEWAAEPADGLKEGMRA